ncbi:MAG: AMP-binding protein [Bdellovibrionota bacterium]
MIDFSPNQPNQLLLNPRLSIAEKNILNELKHVFDKKYSDSGYFLIASSGSSQKSDESVKLIALHVDKILNSARRFNQYFITSGDEHWGLVLPEFHVAGLSIRARAFLSGAKVFEREWKTDQLTDWIEENKICYISMVPAQIYDLAQKQIRAPKRLKKVFVGASHLATNLQAQILKLNWPFVETYGMTETSSMIAFKENSYFTVLPGVEIKTNLDLLAIRCNSLMSASLQKSADQIIINELQENSWFQTNDHVEILRSNDELCFRFLGRSSDYIKILGEGVSLVELRSRFADLMFSKNQNVFQFELSALNDDRAGFKLVLVVENALGLAQAKSLMELFNSSCRPYEKIQQCVVVGQIPRTDLGKLKTEELNHILIEELSKGSNG